MILITDQGSSKDIAKKKPQLPCPGTENPKLERAPDGTMRRKRGRNPRICNPEAAQTWQEALEWVLEHLDGKVAKVPSRRALQYWLEAMPDSSAFRKKYLPKASVVSKAEWDGRGLCPTCNREVDVTDSAEGLVQEAEERIIGNAIRVGKGTAP